MSIGFPRTVDYPPPRCSVLDLTQKSKTGTSQLKATYCTVLNCFSSVQSLSHFPLFVTPWIAARQASLSITISRSSPKPMSIESVMPSSPQSLPASGSFPVSQLFSWGGQSTGVSALASSLQRNPRADLLQNGLVGSSWSPRDSQDLLQHHSSKASILQRSAFFTVQLSHPYMTAGKTIALTRWTFVLQNNVSAFEYAI